MGFDPALLKKLTETFKVELEEQLEVITNGIRRLEKTSTDEEEQSTCIEAIFRAAHNIKGAARSLAINDVADIAHLIESLFSSLQKKELFLSSAMIDLGFEAVDKMRLAMQFFLKKQPLSFNLADVLARLEQETRAVSDSTLTKNDTKSVPKNKDKKRYAGQWDRKETRQ